MTIHFAEKSVGKQLFISCYQMWSEPAWYSNVLPKLDFEVDNQGFLWVLPPKWGVNDNGVIGYGRFLK